MIRVTTPCRLHFGLLRLPPSDAWMDDGRRYFGGMGLMLDEPRVMVTMTDANEWSWHGPSAERAKQVLQLLPECSPQRVVIECPPEHTGLGVGTQLTLAIATALCERAGMLVAPETLAIKLDRGRRSAIGVHGFRRGGFIVDHGKRRPDELGLLGERLPFPQDWRVVLSQPHSSGDWHGDRERSAFDVLPCVDDERLEHLMLAAVAAIRSLDLPAFGDAIEEYNRRVGEQYRDVQGGTFASPAITDEVRRLKAAGAVGVGQSSWGPTVFGFVPIGRQIEGARSVRAAQFQGD